MANPHETASCAFNRAHKSRMVRVTFAVLGNLTPTLFPFLRTAGPPSGLVLFLSLCVLKVVNERTVGPLTPTLSPSDGGEGDLIFLRDLRVLCGYQAGMRNS